MNNYTQELREIAKKLVAPGKGILAIDESSGTCNQRFEKLGIPTTEEYRRDYREMILTVPNLSASVSGPILYDETIRQSSKAGIPFVTIIQNAGMIPGIKLDTGAKPLAGSPSETVTEGLDGLRDRIAEYYKLGARFAKWRAVITIKDQFPSSACLETNAHALARYAALCQEGGLVPIVEPEILIDGDHSLERCYDVTDRTLHAVFNQLYLQGVALDQIILKPSMVISGKDCPQQASVDEVAEATIRCLLKSVPANVAGIAFLSGGQSVEQATLHLNTMNVKFGSQCPWPVTFSYGRAIQQTALDFWKGKPENALKAQKILGNQAQANGLASQGQYSGTTEKVPAIA